MAKTFVHIFNSQRLIFNSKFSIFNFQLSKCLIVI